MLPSTITFHHMCREERKSSRLFLEREGCLFKENSSKEETRRVRNGEMEAEKTDEKYVICKEDSKGFLEIEGEETLNNRQVIQTLTVLSQDSDKT